MKKVLFVCSGNTCRSPMAQAVFNAAAEKRGLDAVAFSAGLYTQDGLPYAANTVEVLRDNGISLSGTSKQITDTMLTECDIVFGLTYSINTALVAAFPEYQDKIYRFPLEVPDPFGGDIMLYRRSLIKITDGVEKILRAIEVGKL